MESMKNIFSVVENEEPSPRRRHRKSRMGCQTCKRRHVRCDEFYPVCRNCSRLGLACEYSHSAERILQTGESSQSQDLQSGQSEADSFPPPFLSDQISSGDQRLVSHLVYLADNLTNNGINDLSLSARELPLFIDLGKSHDSIREALLAISATHLGKLTRSAELDNLALAHQTSAYSCLQESINNFSQQNADATLATSIVLAFQAPDWRAWSRLVQGNVALITAMRPWISQSVFYEYIIETLRQSYTNQTSTPNRANLVPFQSFSECLNAAASFMGQNNELQQLYRDLLVFTQNLRNFPPEPSSSDQFKIAFQLRCWLFWMPDSYLKTSDPDVNIVVAFAFFNSMVWSVREFFPAVPDVVFRKTRFGDMQRALDKLVATRAVLQGDDKQLEEAISLLGSTLEVADGLKLGERLE